jgi:hypothetical protein
MIPKTDPIPDRKTEMIGHHAFRGMKALAFALVFTTATAAAQADTKIKLVLNWKYEGPQGMFFLAQDRGYFKQAASTSPSTRATARARCRKSPMAPTTWASATSMR